MGIRESLVNVFTSSSHKTITESGIGLVSKPSIYKEIDDDSNDDKHLADLKLYRNAYLNVPMIQGIIDIKTDQAIQEFYFDGPNAKKLTKWADEVNLMQFFHNICKQMLIFGNGFVEIIKTSSGKVTELKILNPEYINVIAKPNGTVIGYLQKIDDKKVIVWGTTGKTVTDSSIKESDIDSISHFRYNVLNSEKYGTSMLRSMLPVVDAKLDMEQDLKKIVKRYGAPLIVAKVGNDNLPASPDEIDTVSQELQDIHSESELVTSHLVEIDVKGFDKKGVDLKTPFNYIDTQIIAGGQVPGFLLGMGEGVDRAVAEVGLRSFDRHIKSIQRILKIEFEDKIIKKHLGTEKDKLIWLQADERETDVEIERIRGLVKDGILSPQKANSLLPPDFHEKLPEIPLAEPRTSQGKGPDKIKDNPNDPTMSTELKPGKRVKRTDYRSSVDDKGSTHK